MRSFKFILSLLSCSSLVTGVFAGKGDEQAPPAPRPAVDIAAETPSTPPSKKSNKGTLNDLTSQQALGVAGIATAALTAGAAIGGGTATYRNKKKLKFGEERTQMLVNQKVNELLEQHNGSASQDENISHDHENISHDHENIKHIKRESNAAVHASSSQEAQRTLQKMVEHIPNGPHKNIAEKMRDHILKAHEAKEHGSSSHEETKSF